MHENDDGGALPAARGAAEQGVGLVEQRPRVVHQFFLPRLKLGVPRHALDSSIPIGKKHCYTHRWDIIVILLLKQREKSSRSAFSVIG